MDEKNPEIIKTGNKPRKPDEPKGEHIARSSKGGKVAAQRREENRIFNSWVKGDISSTDEEDDMSNPDEKVDSDN